VRPRPFPGQAQRRPGIQGVVPVAPGSRIACGVRESRAAPGGSAAPLPPSPLILRSARRARLEGGLQCALETPSCFETARAAPPQHEGCGDDVRECERAVRPGRVAPAPIASWREPEAADPIGGSSEVTLSQGPGQILRGSRGSGRRGGGRKARRGWAGQGSPAPQPPHGSIHGDTTPHSGSAPRLRSPETDTAIPAAAQRSARSGRGSGPSLVPPESGMHHHPCRRTVPPAAPAW
jgi:hypothetical protein